LEGQVAEAFSRPDWFKKWGVHYLPSLVRAHLLQQCNNFKDPGVQVYGGRLFRELQLTAEEIFCKIPPPTPTQQNQYSNYSSSYTPPVSMAVYNSSSNVCFGGDCLLTLADGKSKKKIKHVEKGDLIKSLHGLEAKILCVIKNPVSKNHVEMVQLKGGLKITPWHPIRLNGVWTFPKEVANYLSTKESLPCDTVYNFVLDKGHVVFVNDVECVTLGHGFEGDVVSHPYFGTNLVIRDLKKMKGWNEGCVEVDSKCIVRDPKNDLICQLRP